MRRKIFTLVVMVTLLLFSTTALAFNTALPIDGIYSLQPKCAPDKELSVENHATNWGANVIDNINSNWRKWKIQRIPGTDFYSIIAIHSNLSLDVANAQATNGVNIATWPYLDGIQNQFRFWDAGNGYYIIQANIGGNFVLDVERAENRAGANVLSWSFHGGDNQLWRLVKIQRLSTFQPYDKVATKTVPAYVMPDLTARSGNEQVDKGDKVTVLREEGNAIFVRYPIRGGTKERWVNKEQVDKGDKVTVLREEGNAIFVRYPIRGGTKERWVNKNEIFGGSNKADFQLDRNSYSVSSPANYQLRFTGRVWNANNSSELTGIHVYIGGGAGAGGQFLGEFKSDNNHNFNATLNVPQNRSGNQLVVIYAVNGVESKELDRRTVNILPTPTPSGGYIWPIKDPSYDNYTINTLYYYSSPRHNRYEHSTWYERYNGGQFYSIDIRAALKTKIVSVANGTVIECYDPSSAEKAKYVKISHGSTESLYAHLYQIDVKEGQTVSAGQVIGLSGDTGVKGSPHLHFEFSNMNAFKYYRDKYPLHYRVWIRDAYNTVKNSIGEKNRREFEDAINWINAHGGFIN